MIIRRDDGCSECDTVKVHYVLVLVDNAGERVQICEECLMSALEEMEGLRQAQKLVDRAILENMSHERSATH